MKLEDQKNFESADGRKVRVDLQKFDLTGLALSEGRELKFTAWFDSDEHARIYDLNGKQIEFRGKAHQLT